MKHPLQIPQSFPGLPSLGRLTIAMAITAVTAIALGRAVGADYPTAVLNDGPKAYYRLGDDPIRRPINANSGSLGPAGNATNDLPVVRSSPGAIVGDGDRSAFFDFTSRTEIPWNAALNPPVTQPFTVEAWFYPASDQIPDQQSLCL